MSWQTSQNPTKLHKSWARISFVSLRHATMHQSIQAFVTRSLAVQTEFQPHIKRYCNRRQFGGQKTMPD